MIPYGRQNISEADIEAVAEVLRSDFLTQGPKIPAFEKALRDITGATHVIACNSATSALHLACMALDLGPGDILWTTPITFVASANCARYCGAEVDFVDIDPKTYNMSAAALAEKLADAKKKNRLPKIIVPVHLTGQSCDMASIGALAREYGVAVVEDASHAVGGRYRDAPVGNCEFSDIAIFSFHPVKIVTTAEGGVAMTQNDVLAQRMDLLRSHGVTRDEKLMTGQSDGPWYYEQIDLGYNYRMTDMQAALGISQLARLDAFISRRHQIKARYDELLEPLPIVIPWQDPDQYSALHLYVIRLKLDEIGQSHREVFEQLRASGIGVNLHYIPLHLQPYYRDLGFHPGMFPEAEQYYKEAISLPMFPDLTSEQQDKVIDEICRLTRD